MLLELMVPPVCAASKGAGQTRSLGHLEMLCGKKKAVAADLVFGQAYARDEDRR